MVSHGTNTVKDVLFIVCILTHDLLEKIFEGVINQTIEVGITPQMFTNKLGKRCTIAIRERMFVYLIEQFSGSKVEGVIEIFTDRIRHYFPYIISDNFFANIAATSFITQQKSK